MKVYIVEVYLPSMITGSGGGWEAMTHAFIAPELARVEADKAQERVKAGWKRLPLIRSGVLPPPDKYVRVTDVEVHGLDSEGTLNAELTGLIEYLRDMQDRMQDWTQAMTEKVNKTEAENAGLRADLKKQTDAEKRVRKHLEGVIAQREHEIVKLKAELVETQAERDRVLLDDKITAVEDRITNRPELPDLADLFQVLFQEF